MRTHLEFDDFGAYEEELEEECRYSRTGEEDDY